jgi:hypothetical protein
VETFVVRVWTPAQALADEVPLGELHGIVERVGSDQRRQAFRSSQELLEILRSATPLVGAPVPRRFKKT